MRYQLLYMSIGAFPAAAAYAALCLYVETGGDHELPKSKSDFVPYYFLHGDSSYGTSKNSDILALPSLHRKLRSSVFRRSASPAVGGLFRPPSTFLLHVSDDGINLCVLQCRQSTRQRRMGLREVQLYKIPLVQVFN